MRTSMRNSQSEIGSVIRTGLTALCLTTALCTPSFAGGVSLGGAGRAVGGALGGAVGGVGGAVGGMSGGVGGGVGGALGGGGISSGGGGLNIGGVSIGNVGGGGSHFTGSNFFSGGIDFGIGSARSFNRGVNITGQRITRHTNGDSAVAAKGLKHKSKDAVARIGHESIKAQAAAKRALPEFATRKRTINVGGANGITAKVNPDPSAQVIVGGKNPANPAVDVATQTGDGSSVPLVTTGSVLNAAGATTGAPIPAAEWLRPTSARSMRTGPMPATHRATTASSRPTPAF